MGAGQDGEGQSLSPLHFTFVSRVRTQVRGTDLSVYLLSDVIWEFKQLRLEEEDLLKVRASKTSVPED